MLNDTDGPHTPVLTPERHLPVLGPLLVLVLLASLFLPAIQPVGRTAYVPAAKPWCLIEDPDVPDEAYRVERFARTHNFAAPPGLKGNSTFVDINQDLPPLLRPYKEYDVFPPVIGVGRRPERVLLSTQIPYASWYTPNHYDNFVLMFPLTCVPRPG